MRIFNLSSLIIPALAATGAVISHAPMALGQTTPPGSIPAMGAPLPGPVVSTPLPPLPVGRPAVDAGAAASTNASSSVMGRALAATPVAPQALLPGNGGDGVVVAAPAYAPAVTPHLVEPFKSMRDAFSKGMKGYNAGDKVDAARAFAYAAAQGHALSSWKLARMYAEGDGVPHDDLKAFEYYSKIADEDTDEGPASPNARFIANAYVALGTYFLDGIPNTYVKVDPERARSLFEYAATLFGDPDAQYNLAHMLADGTGGPKDVRQAVRWLNLAAEKNHRPSQALLGHILFTGTGVPRQAAQGLMWLSLAREGADPTKDAWITQLRDQAFAAANENERQLATLYLDQHGKGR
jgi:tetratricopeptide (TPR) repeat protein